MSITTSIQLEGRYDIWLRDPNGRRFRPRNAQSTIKNVITDNGIDSCFNRSFCYSRQYLAIGKGTSTATSSDSGLSSYYTTSQTLSATENGYTPSRSGKYVEDYATHTWTNSTGTSQTITEFGVTWLKTSNPPVFSRIVISGGIFVPNGYELIVRYTLRKGVPAWRSVQAGTITIGGVSYGCKYMIAGHYLNSSDTTLGLGECNGSAFDYFISNGSIDTNTSSFNAGSARLLEPSFVDSYGDGSESRRVSLITSSTQYAGLTDTSDLAQNPDLHTFGATILKDYTNGSFSRTKYYNFIASTLPGSNIYGFIFHTSYDSPMFICRFDEGHVKASNHTWTCGMTTQLARA